MNRFYKYLKSFDSTLLDYSKVIGRVLPVLAIIIFSYKFSQLDVDSLDIEIVLSHSIYLWLILLLCFIINHVLDAIIWRYILVKEGITISIKEALYMNWKSLLYSISTPSRIGEIPARRILLKAQNDIKVYKSASIHYVFKPISFLFTFGLSYVVWKDHLSIIHILLIGSVFVILLYLLIPSIRKYVYLVVLNIFRIITYSVQHGIIVMILGLFTIKFKLVNVLVLIHSLGALLPHIFGTEIFMKSAIFELIDINLLSWESFVLSVILLWIMNIVLPALIALGLKKYDYSS